MIMSARADNLSVRPSPSQVNVPVLNRAGPTTQQATMIPATPKYKEW
jgi:hypothetical protein